MPEASASFRVDDATGKSRKALGPVVILVEVVPEVQPLQ